MTIRPHSTVRRSGMSRRQVVLMSLLGALSLTTALAFAQSADGGTFDDVDAIRRIAIREIRLCAAEQPLNVRLRCRIPAQHTMPPQGPQVATCRDWSL
jgi:hypothetical protein